MIGRVLAGVFVASMPLLAQVPKLVVAAGTPCGNLAALTIPSVVINAATAMTAGDDMPFGQGIPKSPSTTAGARCTS